MAKTKQQRYEEALDRAERFWDRLQSKPVGELRLGGTVGGHVAKSKEHYLNQFRRTRDKAKLDDKAKTTT